MEIIKVEHPNGYYGILYGEDSMSILDNNDHEILHTGKRKINTAEELYFLLQGINKTIITFQHEEIEKELKKNNWFYGMAKNSE